MDERHVIYGREPTVPLFKGTAGQQVYKALLGYQHLPEAMICAHSNQILSYKTLLEKSCQLAQAFLRNKFSQNTVVSICSENCLEFLWIIIASWYIGMTVAPINYEYIKDELYHVINLSKAEVIFCSRTTLEKVKNLQIQMNDMKRIIVIDGNCELEGTETLCSFISYKSPNSFNSAEFKPFAFDCDTNVALVLCSSGTTGLPKGVMITHKNLVYRFSQTKELQFNFVGKPGSTSLNLLPLFHAFGLHGSIEALLLGHRLVLMNKFEPNLFLTCIETKKVNYFRSVTPILLFLAKNPLCEQYDLSSLRYILFGATSLSKDLEESIRTRLGSAITLRQGYGLTEITFAATINPEHRSKTGSVGVVVPYVAVKVVDINNGKSLKANQAGELWLKGPFVTKGFISNPEATKNTYVANGWMRTGDIGYYDEEGYFFITDRLKELIKYKGFPVSPTELEGVLLQHPKISSAAVFGIPDDIAGELPAALVIKETDQQLTEGEVLQFVASRISRQKHLHGGVYFVDEIPVTASGKIQRRKVVELFKQKLSKL